MDVFAFTDFRALLRAWIGLQPNEGRGTAKRLAEHLGVSSVLISQVLNGTRSLQMEHAYSLAEFMGLTASETEYFLLLVQYESAGTQRYRSHLKKRIELASKSATQVRNRVARDIQLSEEAKAEFYSHWIYSAVRLSTDIPGVSTPQAIALHLKVDVARVTKVLEFLVEHGLCHQSGGHFTMAVQSTHLEAESPWVYSRQLQWRQKGLQGMETPRDEALYYTGPMVLSAKDQKWIRERLVQAIRDVTERARSSDSEKLCCLNLDWFEL